VTIENHHLFTRLAALEVPTDARAHRAEPRGGDRIKDLAHVRVTRDTLHPVDGMHIALGPFLVKGEERGRFEGKQGERRHESIREGNVSIITASIRDGGEAAADQGKKRIGREMLARLGRLVVTL